MRSSDPSPAADHGSSLPASDTDRNSVIELLRHHTSEGRLTIEEFDQRLDAKGLEDRLTARIAAEIEKPLQGGIGHFDALAGIEDEDAFGHAVEERLLAEFAFGDGAPIFLNKTLIATVPPQMQTSQTKQSNRRNQPGHTCKTEHEDEGRGRARIGR